MNQIRTPIPIPILVLAILWIQPASGASPRAVDIRNPDGRSGTRKNVRRSVRRVTLSTCSA